MAILAAGVGFAIRGGILDNWGAEFGFTATELGNISGAGFTGFCFGIIIGGVIADKIGYGKLVIAAFALHVLSAFVTFAPSPGTPKETVGELLFWGTFIFAVANGTLEAVANPLVATLFSHDRTHYLNILHASWPAGLVLGSAAGWLLDDKMQLSWKLQLALFLLPTMAYGIMFFGQHFPRSEASEKGSESWGNVQGCWHSRQPSGLRSAGVVLWRCVDAILQDQSRHGKIYWLRDWLRPAGRRSGDHALLVRITIALRIVCRSFAGGRGRTGYGQLDSKHHREYLDFGAGQNSVCLHFCDYVCACVFAPTLSRSESASRRWVFCWPARFLPAWA